MTNADMRATFTPDGGRVLSPPSPNDNSWKWPNERSITTENLSGLSRCMGWRVVMEEDASLMQAAGHRLLTPTYTGLGEREHLASPLVDLETHIQDILNVIRYEDLRDIVLLGH